MNIGTLIFTRHNGELVGTDEFGNRYYHSKTKKRWGRDQRWCLFKGEKDSTKVPAEWHAWLHHTVDEPLTQMSSEPKPWQKAHQPNLTGTTGAYRPAGHAYRGGHRAAATGDYEAWTPK
ncbi:MAG: NADH:ubiquinone oxidoreductase subunit NDUFA12 [Rhodospirillaceae bacterium]